LEDLWNLGDDGLHDIWVLGPNGFHRGFRGTGQDGPAIRASQANGRLSLSAENTTAAAIEVVVTPNAYASHLKPWRTRLKPGAKAVHTWDLAKTGGWYDLGVGLAKVAGWEQRLAGRVETGRPSMSDPAMGGPALMTRD
jgi:phospholipase C